MNMMQLVGLQQAIQQQQQQLALAGMNPMLSQNSLSMASHGSMLSSAASESGSKSGSARERSRKSKAKANTSATGSWAERSDKKRTPWYPNGAPQSLSLSDELNAFAQLSTLTEAEQCVRTQLFQSAQRITQQLLPQASCTAVGSFAAGISSHSSGVDIIISNCGELTEETVAAYAILGEVTRACADDAGGDTVLSIEAADAAFTATLIFRLGESAEEERLLVTMTRWVKEFPSAQTVMAVVSHVLSQACTDLTQAQKGGLSPTCLLAMVVHVCRMCLVPNDPGEVLLTFLERYGSEVDYTAQSICPENRALLHKLHPSDAVSVVSPSGANLALGCTSLRQIRAHLQSCHIALRQFEPRKDSHTALSTIISHQPLWRRAELTGGGGGGSGSPHASPAVIPGLPPTPPPQAVVSPPASLDGASSAASAPGLPPAGPTGRFHLGQQVETLRSDGTWSLAVLVSYDAARDRYQVKGDRFIKAVEVSKLRVLGSGGGATGTPAAALGADALAGFGPGATGMLGMPAGGAGGAAAAAAMMNPQMMQMMLQMQLQNPQMMQQMMLQQQLLQQQMAAVSIQQQAQAAAAQSQQTPAKVLTQQEQQRQFDEITQRKGSGKESSNGGSGKEKSEASKKRDEERRRRALEELGRRSAGSGVTNSSSCTWSVEDYSASFGSNTAGAAVQPSTATSSLREQKQQPAQKKPEGDDDVDLSELTCNIRNVLDQFH